jgi:hypothetical protein
MTTNRLNKKMVIIIWEKNIFQKRKKRYNSILNRLNTERQNKVNKGQKKHGPSKPKLKWQTCNPDNKCRVNPS